MQDTAYARFNALVTRQAATTDNSAAAQELARMARELSLEALEAIVGGRMQIEGSDPPDPTDHYDRHREFRTDPSRVGIRMSHPGALFDLT